MGRGRVWKVESFKDLWKDMKVEGIDALEGQSFFLFVRNSSVSLWNTVFMISSIEINKEFRL